MKSYVRLLRVLVPLMECDTAPRVSRNLHYAVCSKQLKAYLVTMRSLVHRADPSLHSTNSAL